MLTQDVTRTLRAASGVHHYVWTMVQGIARAQIEEAQVSLVGGQYVWNSSTTVVND